MSTPVNPTGLELMPWEHCAASIETGGEQGAIIARISCTGSAHDRAKELFAYLVGGTVDYGEEHSREHGHPRFGRTYTKAAHPEWGPGSPIHLLGHSAGGIAVLVFQQMVHQGEFAVDRTDPVTGEVVRVQTDASWIRSVVTLQAPLRGTPGAELFWAEYHDDGVVLPRFTLAHFMSIVVLLYDKWAPRCLQRVFEVESPHSENWRERSLWDCLSHDRTYLAGRDSCLYDLSPNYADKVLRHIELSPSIYYISLATQCTHTKPGHEEIDPDATMMFLFRPMAHFLARREGFGGEVDGRHSDGLVPLESQRAPPGHAWAELPEQPEGGSPIQVPKGTWQVWHGRGDHLYYMFCPRRLKFYTDFYGQLFCFLKRLP